MYRMDYSNNDVVMKVTIPVIRDKYEKQFMNFRKLVIIMFLVC